ncbi:hypothetical protein B1759_14640 [Rubrivirga sp. SAORIC476]|uniref:MORN repeat-containing protein n=1 Tax=Rubrivirga sp. SAORIC476 TaxID=1961794 RepID=UPI000BA8F9D1|nr:hypothetical protein [Rubrivirga sp. SAORIC476]PAP79557.1 hypothetical protein B1759_14640 [Rubrivirga sp. SAORIC476]
MRPLLLLAVAVAVATALPATSQPHTSHEAVGCFAGTCLNGTGVATANGHTYRGSFREGRPFGSGVLTLESGTRIEATFDGEGGAEGSVVRTSGWRYQGGLLETDPDALGPLVPHGQGRADYPSGDRYEGGWRNGKLHGQGVNTFANGNRYEGAFANGKRWGLGVFLFADGRRYEGAWQDDAYHGRGVHSWPDGRRYEGLFVSGERQGEGLFTWPDGRRYEGQFESGTRQGIGVFTWPDGRRYEGQFASGERHGTGVFTFSDGKRFDGTWVDDAPVDGTLIPLDGEPYPVRFEGGEFVRTE